MSGEYILSNDINFANLIYMKMCSDMSEQICKYQSIHDNCTYKKHTSYIIILKLHKSLKELTTVIHTCSLFFS